MKPVNSKSLFATLCATLEKLDSNEIDTNKANAAAMSDPKIKAEHRNIEMKNFDCIPE